MIKNNGFYIGVDGGGTHTRALLANRHGRVLGAGHIGSANRNHHARDYVIKTLEAVLRQSLCALPDDGQLSAVFLGMGGVSTQSDKEDIIDIVSHLPDIPHDVIVTVDNDTVVGLTGGLSGRPGLALIAGTGSACLGINAQGAQWLCGGWGAIADDAGSAPWIGLRALQTAVRAEDGRMEPTLLQQVVYEFLQLSEWRELVNRLHNDGLTRTELGSLAPLVIDAYLRGDAAASSILRESIASLSGMVGAVVNRLFPDIRCEMVLVGGLALSGPPYQSLLTEMIQNMYPQITLLDPELTPVQGAVLEALRSDGIIWTESIIENLRGGIFSNSVDQKVLCPR